MLGKIEGRRRGRQRMRQLDGITDAMNKNLGKLWDVVRGRVARCAAVHGVTKNRTQLDTEQQQQCIMVRCGGLFKICGAVFFIA